MAGAMQQLARRRRSIAALEEAAKQRADAVAKLKSEALALRNRASEALAKAAQVDEQVREAEAQALSVQQALSEAQAELDAAIASLAASMPPPPSWMGAPPSHLTAPAVGPRVQAPSVAASAPTLPQRAPDVLSASTAAPPPAQAPLTAPVQQGGWIEEVERMNRQASAMAASTAKAAGMPNHGAQPPHGRSTEASVEGLLQQNKLLQQQLQELQEALLRFRDGVQGAADAPMDATPAAPPSAFAKRLQRPPSQCDLGGGNTRSVPY